MLRIKGVVGFDEGYIEIVQSPLVVTVRGGTGVGKGYKQNLTLDASGSQDPDVGLEQYENLTMAWECMAENVPTDTTEGDAGCSVNVFKTLYNGSALDLVLMNTSFTRLPNINYALRVTLVKNHRRMLMYFNLHTREDNMLRVFIQ